jgi:hypothetical protein
MVAGRMRRRGGAKKMFADVGAIQAAELPQQFTGPFIADRRQHDLQVDYQIAGLTALHRRWHARAPES